MTGAELRKLAAHHVIPPSAAVQWRVLVQALAESGPAPCEQSADADLWWPPDSNDVDAATALCTSCLAVKECLDYALAARERFGVWGALTPEERVR